MQLLRDRKIYTKRKKHQQKRVVNTYTTRTGSHVSLLYASPLVLTTPESKFKRPAAQRTNPSKYIHPDNLHAGN